MSKRTLSFEEIEAQSALELPKREMMLVTIVITNVLNNLSIPITVKNNNVAVQICAVVQALNVLLVDADPLTQDNAFTCEVQQKQ